MTLKLLILLTTCVFIVGADDRGKYSKDYNANLRHLNEQIDSATQLMVFMSKLNDNIFFIDYIRRFHWRLVINFFLATSKREKTWLAPPTYPVLNLIFGNSLEISRMR